MVNSVGYKPFHAPVRKNAPNNISGLNHSENLIKGRQL